MFADANWTPKCRYRQEDPVDLFYWRLTVWAILSADKSTATGQDRQERVSVLHTTDKTRRQIQKWAKRTKMRLRKSSVSRAGTAEGYRGGNQVTAPPSLEMDWKQGERLTRREEERETWGELVTIYIFTLHFTLVSVCLFQMMVQIELLYFE